MAVSYFLQFVNRYHHNINELHLFIVTMVLLKYDCTYLTIESFSKDLVCLKDTCKTVYKYNLRVKVFSFLFEAYIDLRHRWPSSNEKKVKSGENCKSQLLTPRDFLVRRNITKSGGLATLLRVKIMFDLYYIQEVKI